MVNPYREQTVVFIHIPKTAGTTLNLIIERQYHPNQIVSIPAFVENPEHINRLPNLPPTQKKQLKVIKGHTFFGWHQLLSLPCAYFTLLRDPIERFISNYYFLLNKKGHKLGQKLLAQQVTIEEFACWSGEDNYQTRFLAKDIGESNLNLKENECTREVLEQAKKNLRDNFSVVGTVEEFDKTLMLLKKTFGWKNVFYKVKNQNKQRPKQSLISKKTLSLIREKNQLDLKLYQYAREILQSLVRNQGDFFEQEVEDFQSINNSSFGQFSALMSSSANKVQKIITFN